MRNLVAVVVLAAACGGSDPSPPPTADPDAPAAAVPDAAPTPGLLGLGTVTTIADPVPCPPGGPGQATCRTIEVSGCPGIETEALQATVAVLEPLGTVRGTVIHLKGGGGEEWETIGDDEYRAGGLRQVYVLWASDWEQTESSGIKTAACRAATAVHWIFTDIHGGSRDLGFCAQGKSGGSGQLGYALAHYGGGAELDYVNEISGPPFARIDLGCDGDAPHDVDVCGVACPTRLPDKVGPWENIPPPLVCGSTGVPADELARWRDDSIAYGGEYTYPDTRVEFWDCTHTSSAVTAMSQIYYDAIWAENPDPDRVLYHCFGEADGCVGEGLGTGEPIAIQAMLDGCIPNHR